MAGNKYAMQIFMTMMENFKSNFIRGGLGFSAGFLQWRWVLWLQIFRQT